MSNIFIGVMMLKVRSLIEPGNFSIEETDALFSLAEKIEDASGYLRASCRGKVLATLFFEPSTRTRLSFEAAMLRLGGGLSALPHNSTE
jgi:aspartate carbamoyltransferase catalytic subunit